ncbi:glycosyltransferase, partial [bacterium]|nr:glycosyltransferase [bacterium]
MHYLNKTMDGGNMNISFIAVKHLMLGGGIEKYTLEVASRLVKKGHKVTVYSMRHHGPEIKKNAGIRIVNVPCIKGATTEKISASAYAAIIEMLKNDKTDIVHLHSVAAGTFAFLPKIRRV